jgi:hypothetical protein
MAPETPFPRDAGSFAGGATTPAADRKRVTGPRRLCGHSARARQRASDLRGEVHFPRRGEVHFPRAGLADASGA